MWRRLASVCILWAGIAGLLPAAAACVNEMPARDCCPPGEEMPCAPASAPSLEAAACCGALVAPTPSLGVSKERSEQHSADVPSSDVPAIVAGPIPSTRTRPAEARDWVTDTESIALNGSQIYLQTARLRL